MTLAPPRPDLNEETALWPPAHSDAARPPTPIHAAENPSSPWWLDADDDVARVAASMAHAAVEVATGTRPLHQLDRWLGPRAHEQLRRHLALYSRLIGNTRNAPITIRRIRVCPLDDAVAEAAVVLSHGDRIRFAAIRLEIHRERWRATVLELAA